MNHLLNPILISEPSHTEYFEELLVPWDEFIPCYDFKEQEETYYEY